MPLYLEMGPLLGVGESQYIIIPDVKDIYHQHGKSRVQISACILIVAHHLIYVCVNTDSLLQTGH